MLKPALHREDVKAMLRKRYGTIANFAETKGLKGQAVADFLRGRMSAKVAEAIAAEFQIEAHQLSIAPQSIKLDNSGSQTDLHRLNVEAR